MATLSSIVSFIVLGGLLQSAYCISHKEKHYRYIQDVLNKVAADVPPIIVEPPPVWFRSGLGFIQDPYHYLRPTHTMGSSFTANPTKRNFSLPTM